MSGPYQKGNAIGRGSAATVYEGRDNQLDRAVAIKELDEPYASNEAFVSSFFAEASRMSDIVHPNVLTIHTVDSSHAPAWLILELADGGTLRQLMARGAGQPAQVVQILRQVLPGLAAIHQHGLLHRNLKPENILLCRTTFKIGDFGLTTLADGRTLPFSSPKYVAPEGLQTPDWMGPAADLYSLGLVIYEFLLGETRFRQAVEDVLRAGRGQEEAGGDQDAQPWFRFHLGTGELPPLHTLESNVPEALSRVVQKMVRKDLAQRYASCDEVLADLHQATGAGGGKLEGEPPTVTVRGLPSPKGRGRLWLGLAAGAVGLLALSVLVTAMLVRRPARRTPHKPPVEAPPLPPPPVPRKPPPPPPPEPFSAAAIRDVAGLTNALLALRSSDDGLTLDFDLAPLEARIRLLLDTPLRFRLASDRPGFVALFALSADGSIVLLYPNRRRSELLVGSVPLVLPLDEDLHDGFRIVASQPLGRDLVFALTSTTPLPPPPLGTSPDPWLTGYAFAPGGVESPALAFARWVAGLRRAQPAQTRLVVREMQVAES